MGALRVWRMPIRPRRLLAATILPALLAIVPIQTDRAVADDRSAAVTAASATTRSATVTVNSANLGASFERLERDLDGVVGIAISRSAAGGS